MKVSDGLGVADLLRVAKETDEVSVGRRASAPAPLPEWRSRDRSPPIRKGKWPDEFLSAFQYPVRGVPPQIPEGGGEGERKGLDSPTSLSKSARQYRRRPSKSVDLTAGASSEAVEPISPMGRPRRQSSRHSADVLLPKEVSLGIGRESTPPSLHGQLAWGALQSAADAATRPPFQDARDRLEMGKESSFEDQSEWRLARRSRSEEVINLGETRGFSGERSLMIRSAVSQRLVVKEEGKPPTRYVSFVIRALALALLVV